MLEIRDVSLGTNGLHSKEILKDICATFDPGKLYVVTGPNGGGKTSFAKLIMGILSPRSGTLLLDGRDITGLTVSERAKLGIGYSFQSAPRFKGIKVSKLLALAAGKDAPEGEASSLLYRVGLDAREYLNRDADGGLSGGEMKRIEIATVLARRLKVAIFDEPEAGIDLWSIKQLSETFRAVHAQSDLTMIIISHQERIISMADELLVMTDGRISAWESAEDFLAGIGETGGRRFDRDREEVAHA
jgi:ABC-type transport system involved in Fe-S cluster assembly, ATPase component